MDDKDLCIECEYYPDPERERESSGYCPVLCADCGGCVGCDGGC